MPKLFYIFFLTPLLSTSKTQDFLYIDFYALQGKPIVFGLILKDPSLIGVNKILEEVSPLGTVEPWPKILSKNFQVEIQKSQRFYEQRNFDQAAKILENPFNNEPDNLFILDHYAKALYYTDREKAMRSIPI